MVLLMVKVTKHGHVNGQVVQHFTSDLTARPVVEESNAPQNTVTNQVGQVIVIVEDTTSILQVQYVF